MRWQLASTFALGAMSAACYGPSIIECENGVRCPSTRACTENDPDPAKMLPQCESPPNVASCTGIGDYERCDEAVRENGYCLNRVCVDCVADLAVCRTDGWQPMTVPAVPNFKSVWMSRPDLAFAVGGSRIFQYDGKTWADAPSLMTLRSFFGVWADGTEVFTVDAEGEVYRGIPPQLATQEPAGNALSRVWGSSATDVIVVGNRARATLTGSTWSWESEGTDNEPSQVRLNDVWGSGTTVVAVATNELHVRRAGAWLPAAPGPNASDRLVGVWFSDERDIFVVAQQLSPVVGKLYRYRWTTDPANGTWELQTVAGLLQIPQLMAIWGASENAVYAVGYSGTILEFDGVTWTPEPGIDPSANFEDVAGVMYMDADGSVHHDAIAVGASAAFRVSR